jgi:hypothetical protein
MATSIERAIAKRLKRRALRLTGAATVRVTPKDGAYRIQLHNPCGKAQHLILPRYLRTIDDFADLTIICEIVR